MQLQAPDLTDEFVVRFQQLKAELEKMREHPVSADPSAVAKYEKLSREHETLSKTHADTLDQLKVEREHVKRLQKDVSERDSQLVKTRQEFEKAKGKIEAIEKERRASQEAQNKHQKRIVTPAKVVQSGEPTEIERELINVRLENKLLRDDIERLKIENTKLHEKLYRRKL